MNVSKEVLAENLKRHGPCRSQKARGQAVLTACTLWTGHGGDHFRSGATWTDAQGYTPSPDEIAALERAEDDATETELEVKPLRPVR